MRLPLKHVALVIVVALAVLVGGVLFPMWREAVDRNRDARADPHHIAGDLYFVGAPDVTSFLLLGSAGHVLIGSGYEGTAHKIIDNIQQLGFDIKDVRVLLASDPHTDEAGGFAALQQASGAELWASEANAEVIARGGQDDPSLVYTPYKVMAWVGIARYPPARVDHRVADGEIVRLGPLALTAHITPGHAPGCTTWTFTIRDRDRDVPVVHRCTLALPDGVSLVEPEKYPGVRADFERSFPILRRLPGEIWLTSHGLGYGRYRKYQASLAADDPAAPFIDRDGYRKSIDEAEAKFRQRLNEQQRAGKP